MNTVRLEGLDQAMEVEAIVAAHRRAAEVPEVETDVHTHPGDPQGGHNLPTLPAVEEEDQTIAVVVVMAEAVASTTKGRMAKKEQEQPWWWTMKSSWRR